MADEEYRAVFSDLRKAIAYFDEADASKREALDMALTRAGEFIRVGMLRTRAEARKSGSLRAGRRYLESADAARVRAAAHMLGIPAPLLGRDADSD